MLGALSPLTKNFEGGDMIPLPLTQPPQPPPLVIPATLGQNPSTSFQEDEMSQIKKISLIGVF